MTKKTLSLGSGVITKEWQFPQKEYIRKQENEYSKIWYKILYFINKIVNATSTNNTATYIGPINLLRKTKFVYYKSSDYYLVRVEFFLDFIKFYQIKIRKIQTKLHQKK